MIRVHSESHGFRAMIDSGPEPRMGELVREIRTTILGDLQRRPSGSVYPIPDEEPGSNSQDAKTT